MGTIESQRTVADGFVSATERASSLSLRLRSQDPCGCARRWGIALPFRGSVSDGDADVEATALSTPMSLRRRCVERRLVGSPPVTAINLELPLRADARLGGHFVQGHVDGVGRLDARGSSKDGNHVLSDRATPTRRAALVVEKGSIAIDGVSLTVTALRSRRGSRLCSSRTR